MHAVDGKRFSLFLVGSKSPWFINVCPKFRNIYLSATSSSVCCTYGDLSWLKWFRLSLICPTSKAKLLACGFLKHVFTSTVYPLDVSFHPSVFLSVCLANRYPYSCRLSSFSRCCCWSPRRIRCRPFCRLLYFFPAMSQLLFLLKKLSKGEDDDSYRYR